MNTILAPIDFSQSSVTALDITFLIAEKCDAEIHLVNICELPDLNFDGAEQIAKEDKKVLLEGHQKELERFMEHYESIRDLEPYRHLSVNYEIIVGDVVPEISTYAEKIDVQLIVMGSHGRQESYHKEMGSVAQSLIGQTKTPILATPFDLDVKSLNMRELVYAIDYLTEDYDQLFFMLGLAEMFDGHLHILNVSKHQNQLDEQTQEWFKKTQVKMMDYDRVTFDLSSDGQNVQESIVAFCKKNNISLLGITTKHELDENNSISRPLTKLLNIPIIYFSN